MTFSLANHSAVECCGTTAEPNQRIRATDSIRGPGGRFSWQWVSKGVMVSAVDNEQRKWTSVFTQQDGSFSIPNLRNVDHKIRARLMGLGDEWVSGVAVGTDQSDDFNPPCGR